MKATQSIKQELKAVIADVDALDLPDGAHWAMVHERMGWEYGDAQSVMASDPEFFNLTSATQRRA